MADKTPDQEPSIEEILASIRQIISDEDGKDDVVPDEKPKAPDAPVAPAPVVPQPEYRDEAHAQADDFILQDDDSDDDILDLTAPILDEPETAPVDDAMPDIDLEETFEQAPPPPPVAPVRMPEPKKPDPAPVRRPEPEKSSFDDILTESARQAALSSMAKLTGTMPINRPREQSGVTLEDLVRDMLNPLLRDWMSENLPPMVERMVQKELEKLARQAQDV